MTIQVLPPQVAARIAAGEVVKRPGLGRQHHGSTLPAGDEMLSTVGGAGHQPPDRSRHPGQEPVQRQVNLLLRPATAMTLTNSPDHARISTT